MLKLRLLVGMLGASAALFAVSTGPPIKRTGAEVDGGLNCTACHRTFAVNSGAGRVTVDAVRYYPGRKQIVKVTVDDPAGQKWGFQLTARLKSDLTKQAGSFTVNTLTRVRCDPTGADATGDLGCGGALEFAEHNREATRPGTAGPHVFEVEWTPPGRNMGDVVFYAAGNAANNDSTNQGDHIYTTSATVSAAGCGDYGRPAISGVSDAAGGRPVISSNSIVSIYGSGFAGSGDKYGARRGDLLDGKVPTDLACVAVEVDGKRAPVFYVQDNQINIQAPWLMGSGPVSVKVTTGNDNSSASFVVNQQAFSPALFTFNGTSAAARNASTNYSIVAQPTVVPGGAPAKPDDVVVLYGTGFGFTDPVWQPGEFVDTQSPIKGDLSMTLGGVTLDKANILYSGLSADAPGFYQFNIKLPASVPDGDVPVVISVGGVATQSGVTIPVKR